MESALVLGAGPAAAGAALALSRSPTLAITVLDIGLQLEPELQAAVRDLASSHPSQWKEVELRAISARPVRSTARGLPEKRSYGSDYPFRDVGQLSGITASADATRSVVTAAYGGFSTVWGAQVMPFTAATFDQWPVRIAEMAPHYQAILAHIPFAAESDDLEPMFPLLASANPLPAAAPRTSRVLAAYARHRRRLNRLGITMGKARLALNAPHCVQCAMCMTGCPYGLIYSASQTFDGLRRSDRLTYRSGQLALRLAEEGDKAIVDAKDLATGRVSRFEADRIFVACGAAGTTRLVANSIGLFDREIEMGESQQFTIPMLSFGPVPDPRHEKQFTLNQFNMVIELDELGFDVSQIHFYTYDGAFIDAMPGALRAGIARPLMLQVLRRLTVAIGYLPSWHSPRLRLRIRRSNAEDELPCLDVDRQDPRWMRNAMLRDVLVKLMHSAPYLDLYPFLPKMFLAAGGKSYHFGGSFPHRLHEAAGLGTDPIGRVAGWKRTHLVDASVFPNVPATTFTLTVMANAHRIATEAMALAG